ncbi:MAG: 4-hydroxy-tetrahydrodipicolinate synthase [Lentisphaeria bacterium]|nr:4-hydroxy-tetrahydrodipicolinate synthase [Lentisphaeria bacterium]MBO5764790.1 4-hydroxy-tetrahydrodipicolinate synthase [Lentisphaeria bacterium]MBO7153936.1 4-hydroxy-tetrahydrodipicolinate synthase [Lentisphaeria bacterium]
MLELKGVYTALVTPLANGKVDYAALKDLVEAQIAGKVAGLIPVGTTGESPTLDCDEHMKVIEKVIEFANKRCQVIAGTGANATDEAIKLTREAKALGADASLQVTPYYNKPTQEGLYRHFSTVADTIELPVVLYNVPGRAGVPIAVDTVARLASNPMIVAVKEAGGSVDRVSDILDRCDITVLSGDDSLTLPMMSVGAKGIISVASNIIPGELSEMVQLALDGDFVAARKIHAKYYRLFCDLFIESNPIPVKAAMEMLGMGKAEYRLPLCELSEKNAAVLKDTLKGCGLL